jgi:hypothetical protein
MEKSSSIRSDLTKLLQNYYCTYAKNKLPSKEENKLKAIKLQETPIKFNYTTVESSGT